ncbi:MAG: hypothetical protein H0V53_00355 [Rubrobacter sp.]|nr:hypothetical protein [Rubrobacter sp.]
MNVFFDIQGTLVGAGAPRPRAREAFLEITGQGHDIYLWSSAGGSYAARAAEYLGVEDLVHACSGKEAPLVAVDFTVDDQPGLAGHHGGYQIPPFRGDPGDRELLRVAESLRDHTTREG